MKVLKEDEISEETVTGNLSQVQNKKLVFLTYKSSGEKAIVVVDRIFPAFISSADEGVLGKYDFKIMSELSFPSSEDIAGIISSQSRLIKELKLEIQQKNSKNKDAKSR